MNSILDIILVFSAVSMALSYLYFIKVVRLSANEENDPITNYFILNPFKVYYGYIRCRKNEGLNIDIIFYLHFIFIIITLILGYFIEGNV